ncbi:hypothetical protein L9F63_013952, partial [Diploptera punctata]
YLHYIVHEKTRLQSVLATFPISGPTYLESPQFSGKKKSNAEDLPQDPLFFCPLNSQKINATLVLSMDLTKFFVRHWKQQNLIPGNLSFKLVIVHTQSESMYLLFCVHY